VSDTSLQPLEQKPSEPGIKLTQVNLGVKGNLANFEKLGKIEHLPESASGPVLGNPDP
jgi:hypothetical protein